METKSKKFKPNLTRAKERRRRVIDRLEKQLKSGQKPDKQVQSAMAPLTETDKTRIKKEIEILKKRI